MAAVISSGCVSHSRVEPSTSAKSSVTVPVGSPLTARSLHSVALMLASMRPARRPKHQRLRVYLRPPGCGNTTFDRSCKLPAPDSRCMTIDIALGTELPTIAYEHAQSPDEAHRLIRQARQQGPIAMGPHGPEVLSYELVRTVMRDDRFAMPKGMFLAAQGITSGELWDISLKGLLSLDGAAHHRQRRLVSKAFTPRSPNGCARPARRSSPNSSTTCGRQVGATWSPTSPGSTPSPSSARMLGTPRGRLAPVLRLGRRHLQSLRLERRQRRTRHPARLATPSRAMSMTW